MSDKSTLNTKSWAAYRSKIGGFWLFASATLFFVTAIAVIGFYQLGTEGRGPSSINPSAKKLAMLDDSSLSGLRNTEKLSGPFDINIESDRKASDGPLSPLTLTGTVNASQRLDRVVVQWSLPEEVELISGVPETTLLQLKPDESQVVEITVQPKVIGNHQIHMSAQAQVGNTHLGDVAQFNTRDEEYIREAKERLVERNKEYTRKHHDQKVIQ